MERIEDRSKALSYIGIEVAEALKGIPTPLEPVENPKAKVKEITPVPVDEEEVIDTAYDDTYIEETRFEVKPSLWERIKNSKLVRTLSVITKIRVRLDVPALTDGKEHNN